MGNSHPFCTEDLDILWRDMDTMGSKGPEFKKADAVHKLYRRHPAVPSLGFLHFPSGFRQVYMHACVIFFSSCHHFLKEVQGTCVRSMGAEHHCYAAVCLSVP